MQVDFLGILADNIFFIIACFFRNTTEKGTEAVQSEKNEEKIILFCRILTTNSTGNASINGKKNKFCMG